VYSSHLQQEKTELFVTNSWFIAQGTGLLLKNKQVRGNVARDKGKAAGPGWWQAGVEKVDITKVAHFVLFALLAFLLRLTSPARPVRMLMLDLFMLACATELSQFFINDRSPLFTDVMIDMAGGVMGACSLKTRAIADTSPP